MRLRLRRPSARPPRSGARRACASRGRPARSRSRCRRRPSRCRSRRTAACSSTSTSRTRSRAVQRRLPRHPAALGRVDRRRARCTENGPRLPPGRLHRRSAASTPPGTFGVAHRVGKSLRIVWHYGAVDELAHVHRALPPARPRGGLRRRRRRQPQGLGLRVEEPLDRLTATEVAPGKVLQAWGHPVYVRGDVQLARHQGAAAGARRARRTSSSSSAPLIPRSAFTSTAGMRVVAGQRPREDRRRGDGRRRGVRAGPASASTTRRHHPLRYVPLPARCSARSRRSLIVALVFWFYGRERQDGLRPRVRAGAADRHDARARADAAAAGRRGGVVRVHRDALRPDPPRRLHLDAGHDRAQDLGRPAERERLRSRALGRARTTRS